MKSILIGALILLATAARSAPLARECVVANQFCFALRVPAAGRTPEHRIAQVNDRLAFILGNETCQPSTVRAVSVGADVEIVVGKSLLVTVTGADARAAGLKGAGNLAAAWVSTLQKVLPLGRCR